MAETCTITLKQLPSRSLRKQVRSFVRGEDVSLRDSSGVFYTVDLKRNKLVLKPDESMNSCNIERDRGYSTRV